ncbi:hypothetical protein BPY_23060 [Bifidobacterium psychraerophilum]|uniref:hypothetical protein n=1 Tax=Bifidobacterium psychraerophilum TaxID=218140 RepID=UPI00310EEF14
MTQDYEPIEITESTPEPEEYGTFLVMSGTTVLYVASHMASPVDSYWTDAEGEDCHWSDILNDQAGRGTTIQSLAAHDAQIRAAALTLTDAELDVAAHAAFDSRDDAYDLEEWEDADSDDRERYQCYVRPAFSAVAEHRKEQE